MHDTPGCPATAKAAGRWTAAALAVIVMAMSLAACGRPIGVMEPVAPLGPNTTKIDLLVATTRQPSSNPAILFSGERGSGLKTDNITVSIPPAANREIGQVQWPSRIPGDPSRNFVTAGVQPLLTAADSHAWLRSHMPKSRHVLIFVHGFNNRYEEAVYRFAQIVHDSRAEVAPVVFTWPSRGSIFSYVYDRESTNFSRDALEELMRRAATDPSVGEVTVMAHSMGAWLAVESLRQMAIRDGRVSPKIRNVILASPDLDVDVFASQFAALGKDKPHFTLFVSQRDRALGISRRIAGNVDRLGQIDPFAETNVAALQNLGISVIDLTKLRAGDALNHGTFAASPEVVKLIGTRLLAGQSLTDSTMGLGEAFGAVALGAAETVGTAAGVAVSTPIAVFDRRTRESYGEQWQRVGQSVNNTVGSVGDTIDVGVSDMQLPPPAKSTAAASKNP